MKRKAATIRVVIERGEAGLFYGTSGDLRGLLIAEPSAEKVREKAPKCIAALYHASGIETVDIIDVGRDTWVARPARC